MLQLHILLYLPVQGAPNLRARYSYKMLQQAIFAKKGYKIPCFFGFFIKMCQQIIKIYHKTNKFLYIVFQQGNCFFLNISFQKVEIWQLAFIQIFQLKLQCQQLFIFYIVHRSRAPLSLELKNFRRLIFIFYIGGDQLGIFLFKQKNSHFWGVFKQVNMVNIFSTDFLNYQKHQDNFHWKQLQKIKHKKLYFFI
eukprot:TRINITY_DN19732_c1_g1_i3.p1 TRINITY_DN19732_c1_g1~~TRINITY_DN19732_c1_g1_i3.p1  ORF type:complete len:194 (+),score=-19.64 TRINITY_DN19732_c1_g1_i3:516-1097(+)